MKPTSFSTATLIALSLAACNRTAEPTTVAIDNDAASPTTTEVLPPGEGNALNNVTAAAENAATAAGNAVPAGTDIPAAFRGRWGLVAADCTSTRGDAKGLITVGPGSIRFYESTAKLTSVATNDPEHFVGNFDFSGEGQTWKKSEDLKLTGSSNTLVRTDDEASNKYSRCDKPKV